MLLIQPVPVLALAWWWWIPIGIGGLILLICTLFVMQYFSLWLQAKLSNAPVTFFSLIGMQFRKVKPDVVVLNRISAKKAGMDLPTNQLEAHFLAGGNVSRVVRAMIAADKAKINLSWENATAIDLAGRDILTAVQTSVDPKVIDCPSVDSGKSTIAAVAQDGIQLRSKARVTVRTNIARLVGGATEDTIIARVGEGIVSAIGEFGWTCARNPSRRGGTSSPMVR